MILVNFILWKNWFFQQKQKKQNTTQHQTTNPTSPHTTADPPGNPHLLLKQKHIVHPSPYEVNKPPAVCCLKVLVEKSATRQGFGSRIHKNKVVYYPSILLAIIFQCLQTSWNTTCSRWSLKVFEPPRSNETLCNKHVKYLRNLSEMFLVWP